MENNLYIAHLDRSFFSIFDFNTSQFLPKVIPLKGYFPHYIVANDDYSRIYTLNIRSDSISVINTNSKTVEKIIDLHYYLEDDEDLINKEIYGFQIIYVVVLAIILSFWWKRSKIRTISD